MNITLNLLKTKTLYPIIGSKTEILKKSSQESKFKAKIDETVEHSYSKSIEIERKEKNSSQPCNRRYKT